MHNLEKGKILVTGGAGFIGSTIIWTLNQLGLENIVVTDLLGTDEKWRNLVPLQFSDYLESNQFRQLLMRDKHHLGDIRTVFHMEACANTAETDASYLIERNYEYSRLLAHWALKIDARYLYASSAATYGKEENNMADETEAIPDLRPLNMYAYSKQMFDLYARNNRMLNRITGLKFFNIFGPNENHKGEMRSVVHKAFQQISDTGTMKLFKSHRKEYDDGKQKRDFLYVKDAAKMILHLAESDAYGIYNIGSGEPHSWIDLVNPIFEEMGITPNIKFVEMPQRMRKNYQYYTQAKLEKLRSTGYKAAVTPLRGAVKETVRDYLIQDKRLGE
ncbi:MAG: ADP-L-glycero-D-manno-heptose-6-epimerase [Candidatus Moanabacter tarae]|uniref:ADP-L-glycero-D-manno-heptose-6-epimerase n=1 Tax=Candidatus Moanibacter tarae TaxID=2200854 RepID=A0A2Z4AF52_9BACT|nr:MAG: ADP-L-glycero-D-manno-heptose-6-epimerase [Candidatus Moanabacter tarae]|tara:strand:- start:696 stop:1691 length:996 start_codon:yes stop_codon:yes gene_type:complete